MVARQIRLNPVDAAKMIETVNMTKRNIEAMSLHTQEPEKCRLAFLIQLIGSMPEEFDKIRQMAAENAGGLILPPGA